MNMFNIGTLLCLAVVVQGHSRETPPAINLPQGNKWPELRKYIRTGPNNAQSFHCQATANPPATYKWTKNSIDLISDPNKVSYNKTTGVLTTGEYFNAKDNNGDYQCIASNTQGTAMTPFITLLATRGDTFPGGVVGGESVQVEVIVSKYLKLNCTNVPPSVPQWEFNWEKGLMGINNELTTSVIVQDNRMSIDPEGNLHFLWVEQSDNNYKYMCTAYNSVMMLEVKNTQTYQLNVKEGDTSDRPPDLKYHNDVVVMAGNSAKLTCIFSYYSSVREQLVIDWFLRGKNVSNDTIMQYEGRTLQIPNVQVPDASRNQSGEYHCKPRIRNPLIEAYQGAVTLKITAPPQFIKGMEPVAINVPDGKDAVFKCSTVSYNAHKKPTTWLVNGLPLLGCPPHMFECNIKYPNGSLICISETLHCNIYPDCPDDSDERNCRSFSCDEGNVICNGTCIPITTKCVVETCAYPSFQCLDDSLKCLTTAMLCNDVKDCADGSDEQACPDRQTIQVGRFQFNSERTELRLPSVKSDDTMCFQCMVSNDYGITAGDGCITVIAKIELKTPLNHTYYVEPGATFTLSVDANTDDLWQNQMMFQWYWYSSNVNETEMGKEYEVEELLPKAGYGKYIAVFQNGKNLTLFIPNVAADDTQAYNIYMELTNSRRFSLVIAHKYDRLVHNFTIIGKNITPPPEKIPVVEVASTNLWFIALILAILILFIVVLLIVCYVYRNRGDTYLLDKKEHQAGHDPEKELKGCEFRDVNRVDDDLDDETKGENASLTESVKSYNSDEDNTEEFEGDFDVSKFNEDGSFIGLYGDKKSKYSESKEATV